MTSLKLRLGAGLALSLLAVFALQWLAVTTALQHLAEGQMRTRLEHDLENLLAGLREEPDGRFTLDPARIAPIYRQPLSGHYFQIAAGDQVIRSRSLWDTVLPATLLAPGVARARHIDGPQAQPLLLQEHGYNVAGRPVSIAVAEDLGPLIRELDRFGVTYGFVSAAALVLLVLVQALIVGLALRPIARARADVARLEDGKISALSEAVPAELLPFVRELNRLLATLRRRLERSRHALGNLAHALKTPLTLLTELTARRELAVFPEIRSTLDTQTAALGRLIERELGRARLAGPTAGARFDVGVELPVLIEAVRSLYRTKELAIESVASGDLTLAADREDMLELLGNLLDNGGKWARSRLRVTLKREGGLRLLVEDDGAGLPEERAAGIAERGIRLDESVPGHGLGLAIVRDIVESYNGTLAFERSEALGGLAVRVDLPNV